MSNIAVRVEGLGKRFALTTMPNLSLDEALRRRFRYLRGRANQIRHDFALGRWPKASYYQKPPEEFWAIKDINFELDHGEVMGIIGHNGAGKTTLLKILTQVMAPTTGRAELYGQVGALLEVGTGFNPELSGRENIYLYGAILGMNRADIAKRFDEIVAFAEVTRFIEQPVKNYSSGMHSRLAFAVAAHLECDILLVDEVLSVGDAAFRAKSMGKMKDVTGQGRAVIFVSHNMSAIRNMCSRALVLEHGQIQFSGEAADATEYYLAGVSRETQSEIVNPRTFPPNQDLPICIEEVYILDNEGAYRNEIEYIDGCTIGMKVRIREASRAYYNALWLQDEAGSTVMFLTDEDLGDALIAGQGAGLYDFRVNIPERLLKPGVYRVTWATCIQRKGKVDRQDNPIPLTIVDTHTWRSQKGLYRRQAAVAPELPWQVRELES